MTSKTLYAPTSENRTNWMKAIRQASHYSEFNDLYVLGRRLGKGHFATVYVARRREDNETYAVKIIDKTTLKHDEHEMMRSEMAILKVCVVCCVLCVVCV